MRRAFVGCLALVGLFAILLIVGLGGLVYWGASHLSGAPKADLPAHMVLRIDLGPKLVETADTGRIGDLLTGEKATLRDLVDAIDRAATDGRVAALAIDLSGAQPNLSQAQELRAAVARFRKSGKRSYAFADTFGEGSAANGTFLLASAFQRIWLQPSGEVNLVGVTLERPFFADALRELGIDARFDQRHEFKGGIDSFVAMGYTPELRQSLQALVDDLLAQVVEGVATDRGLPADEVRSLVDQAPLFADEALGAKLVDGLGYRADFLAEVARDTQIPDTVAVTRYMADIGRSNTKGERIALIYGLGPVVRGETDETPLLQSGDQMASETLVKALGQASRDRSVRAIVLRIDSPGGSYVASDAIWRAVHAARERGKPVIVSMGSMAASGGYFAAMAADRIIAEPGTLTGSIGVYSGKFVLSRLWEKLGIRWEAVSAGAHAGETSMNRDFTAEEWSRFQTQLDRIYGDFTQKAAADRKIALDRLDTLARGRVWTGRQAKANGLVDEVGDFATALAEARKAVGLDAAAPIELKTFPEREPTFDRAMRLLSRMEGMETRLDLLDRLALQLAPAAEIARRDALSSPVTKPVQ